MKHLERYALSVSHEIRDQVFPKQKDLVLGRYPIHNILFMLCFEYIVHLKKRKVLTSNLK
jgi:hypothetical protein